MLVIITTVAIISTNIPEAMGREPPREVNHSFEKDREKDPGGTQQTSARTRMEPARRYPKILSKSGPGRSLESPECVRDPSGTHPSDKNAKKRFAEPTKTAETFFKERFWVDFGTRPGPQNRPKTGPGPKKSVRRRRRKRFLSIFLAVAVRSGSPDRFSEGLTLQNCAPTTAGARF